jgi:PAS domain S-box-containing protein
LIAAGTADDAKRAMAGVVSGSDRVRALVYVNVSDVVFLLGIEGDRFRFLEINPMFTKTTGLGEEQVVGRLVDEVIPEPSLTLVLSKYREAITERRTVRWVEVTDYPSGKRYGEVSATPVVGPDGRCTSLVGTVHDVTEEARARALSSAEQQVLELVASSATIEQTLTTLVLAVEELMSAAIASVHLLSADGKSLLPGAAPHLPDGYNRALDGVAIGPAVGSCGTAAVLRRSVIVTDIEVDPLWDAYRDLARRFGLRACWSTPIIASSGRVLGTFAIYYREPRAPAPEDLAVIARVVHVARIAIERHQLDAQLRALAAHLEAAREEERTGIAREIHDQLGQTLTVLKMDLAWISRRALSAEGLSREALLDKVKDLSQSTDEIIQQVRRISAELRPGVLDDIGLVAALSWRAQEFEKRTHIVCTVQADVADEKLSRDVATTVFRVFEEALTNIARHAGAGRVDVRLEEHAGSLVLHVRDDGKGIEDDAIHDPLALGLLGIRERARRLGGTASFARATPNGTEVTLCLPVLKPPGQVTLRP